jgi:glycosyl hydrolase family 106( putative alpha-L-rhamnosidase)
MALRLSRRLFLSRASQALLLAEGGRRAAAFPAPGDSPSPAAGDVARLRRLFGDPPPSARPMTRWWWFGGAVRPDEITRELTFMRDAGLRGAEIQPVYPVAVDDPDRGIKNLRYFSDEWFGVLRHAVREARRLSLQLDFTLGSGWPYGGPFIPTPLSARRLRVHAQDVVGPRTFSWHLAPHVTGDERVVAVVLAPVGPGQEPDLGRARVLGDQPRAETAYNVQSDLWVRDVAVPEGEWRLLVVVDSPTGQEVKRPTLGMEGPVLDHFSREALPLFLRAAGDRVMAELRAAGDPPFHSVFCDSLEVYGADWTSDFPAEFEKRRGYDVRPLLPALWYEAGEKTALVRHDYHQTLSDLTIEYFFAPLAAWAEKRGMRARVQAHGALGDVMRGYGTAHIPEGENIFLGDRYMVNLRHRRLASSAAHLYGKPLASAETYTWLRTPLYMTTLEMMKAATDSTFLDGINHLVNHGYSYSPPEAGEPGWAFYASTEANHTNTWWRHYPHLARYVARAQALLQEGVSVNPVGVYVPLADIYSRFGAGGLNVDSEVERRMGTELLSALRTAGYDFDLVHDHALETLARIEDGVLRAGTAACSVVIVPGAEWMPPASASRLADLAEGGGHVVFVERLPGAAPGLADHEARTADLRGHLRRLWGGREARVGDVVACGRGSVALVAHPAAVRERLAAVLGPDFRILAAGSGSASAVQAARETVGFLHRRSGVADLYFVANISPEERDLRIRLAAGHRAPLRWDPETGNEPPLAYAFVTEDGRPATEVELRLEPFQSAFVVFGLTSLVPADEGGTSEVAGFANANGPVDFTLPSGQVRRVSVTGIPDAVAVPGPWTLRLGQSAPLAMRQLRSWADLPEGSNYSGWATYETTFEAPDAGPDVEWAIDLGRVHETAEVWLNDQALGAAWKRPRRLLCGTALRKGKNRLRVEVANLWIHHMAAQPPPAEWKAVEETFGIRWGRYGEVKPDAMPPAGLLGPVRLLPGKLVRIPL